MGLYVLSFFLMCLGGASSTWSDKASDIPLQNSAKAEEKSTKVILVDKKNHSEKQYKQKQKEKDTYRLRLFLQAKTIFKTPHISDNHWVKLLKKMKNIRTEDLQKVTRFGEKFVTSDMYFSDIDDIVTFLWKADLKRVMHLISVRDSILPDNKQRCIPPLLKTIGSLSDKKFVFLVKNMSSFINKDMSCDTLDKLMKALSKFPKNRLKTLKNNKSFLFGDEYAYHWPDLIEFLGKLDNDVYYKVIKYIPKFATNEMSSLAIIDLVHFLADNDF